MKATWQPIRVGVGSFDNEEQTVLVNSKLVDQKGHLAGRSNNPESQRRWYCALDPSLTADKAQPQRVLS